MAKKLDTAMNVLGTVAAGLSFLNLKSPTNSADSKLAQFYSSFKKDGIAKTNRFETRITMPKILNNANKTDLQTMLTLRCESANIPGVTITTTDIQRYGYGLTEKVPTNVATGDLTCSFIGDADGSIYKLFYRWLAGIIKWDEYPNLAGKSSYNNLRPYEHEYKSEYQGLINIITYSENDDKLISYDFFDVYPVGIGEIQYNWGSNDELVRIPIQFAYSYFKVVNIDENTSFAPGATNSLGMFGQLLKTGTAIQTIASLKKPQSIGDIINVVNNAKIIATNYFNDRN